MTARWHKLHPHVLFPDYDASLYIDGNVHLKAPVSALIDRASAQAPIAMFRHAERDCAYAEAEIVKRYRLDDPAIVDTQIAYYRELGYPPRRGLHVSNVQFRLHNEPRLAELLDDWWQQVKIFSHRDQLSLDFMLMRHGIVATTIPGNITQNDWFDITPHRFYHVDFARNHDAHAGDALDWLRMTMITRASSDRRNQPMVPRLKQAIWWRTTEPMRRVKRLLHRWLWSVRNG